MSEIGGKLGQRAICSTLETSLKTVTHARAETEKRLVARIAWFKLKWHFVNTLSNLQFNQHQPLHDAN